MVLSEAFINDFVRDQQTWRRAAGQRREPDCLDPSTPAARANMGAVFRRGCTDNVCSLKFLNCLRDGGEDPKRRRHFLAWERWDPSTRVTEEGTDPVHELLLRHLVYQGFATSYATARDKLLHRQKAAVAQRQQRRMAQKALESRRQMTAVRRFVMNEESQRRNALLAHELRLRADIISSLWEGLVVAFLNTEFVARRAVFQKANNEFIDIARREDVALQSILAMPTPFHRLYMDVIRRESRRRSQILLDFQGQRDALRSSFQSKTQQLIEHEITCVAEKERVLMKILQLSRRKTKA